MWRWHTYLARKYKQHLEEYKQQLEEYHISLISLVDGIFVGACALVCTGPLKAHSTFLSALQDYEFSIQPRPQEPDGLPAFLFEIEMICFPDL